jgi:hypothetical protein
MGYLLKQLEGPVSLVVAKDFIEEWKALISDWQHMGFL